MLVIDPYSNLLKDRAEEISDKAYRYERFKIGVEEYISDIESCVSTEDQKDIIQILKYSDLLCTPFYVHIRDGVPIKAIQGFYLTNASANFMHIEWSHTATGMTNELRRYFENKWDKWSRSTTPDISGRWAYHTLSDNESGEQIKNEGYCEIYQFGKELFFDGHREWIWNDGQKSENRYNIPWKSVWSKLCSDNIIRGDYWIQTQIPPIEEIPAFFKIELDLKDLNKMTGVYYLLKSRQDISCNIRHGSIVFERPNTDTPESKCFATSSAHPGNHLR